jgi:hypothetical protein
VFRALAKLTRKRSPRIDPEERGFSPSVNMPSSNFLLRGFLAQAFVSYKHDRSAIAPFTAA